MKDTAVSILITPVVLVVMIILAPIFAVSLICSGIMAVFVVVTKTIDIYSHRLSKRFTESCQANPCGSVGLTNPPRL